PQLERLADRPQHDLDAGPRLFASGAGVVVHAHLDDAAALHVGFGVDFGVDQPARAGQVHPFQHIGAKDLEAAVYIAQVDAKEQLDHLVEAGADHKAVEGVVTLDTIARHDVVLPDVGGQPANILDMKLQVGVHEHQVVAGG